MSEVKACQVKRPTNSLSSKVATIKQPLSAKNVQVDAVKSKCVSALNSQAIYSDYSKFKRRETAMPTSRKSPLTLQVDLDSPLNSTHDLTIHLPKSSKFKSLISSQGSGREKRPETGQQLSSEDKKKPDYEAICDRIYSRI